MKSDWKTLKEWINRLPTPVVIHAEGEILYANQEALKLFGAERKEDFIGKRVLEFIHTDSLEVAQKRLKEASYSDPYLPRQEETLVGVDGRIFSVEVTGIRIVYEKKPAIAAFIWDVSPLKELERRHLEDLDFIHKLLSTLPVAVYVKDRLGRYQYVNEKYTQLFGLKKEEILGKTALECWPEPIGESYQREDLDFMKEGGSHKSRYVIQLGDNKEVTGTVQVTRLTDATGSVIGMVGVFMETTEIDRAWRAVEEERERLLTLINASPDIICFKDGKGQWLLANQAHLELFQLTGVDYKGKTDQELALHTHPIYRKIFETCMKSDEAAWSSGKTSRSEEVIQLPDGGSRIYDIYKIPLFTPEGDRKWLVVIGRDITRVKETLKKLQQSEATNRAILEAMPDMVFTLDRSGTFRSYYASGGEKLYQPPEVFLGRRVIDVLPGYLAKMVLKGVEEVFVTGKPVTFEYPLTIRGEPEYFECRMVPKGDEEVLAVIRDITQRRHAEEALKKSEEKYRSMSQLFQLIADNNPVLLWAKDLQGRYIFTNRAIREKLLLAKDAEEPLGKDDLFFAKRIRSERPDRDDWHTFGELCVNSDEVTLKAKRPMRFDEYGNVRGKFLYLDVHKAPLRDLQGNIIGTVGSGRDVTFERELKAKASRLATVVEQANQVIVVTDLDANILYVNPAFERMTGYTVEEVRGKNPRILQSGKHDKAFYMELWRTLTEGRVWEGTFLNKKKNGDLFYEKAVIFPIRDDTGKVVQYAAIKEDITREKLLEEQLTQAQKMEAIGTLAGGVAHDFNNMLNVIMGYAELGMMRLKKGSPGYRELSNILSAGKKAGHLVSQLLAFSRRQPYSPRPLDVNGVIQDLEKMFRRLVGEDIDISVVLSPGLPLIEADPVQLDQVLMNLIVNAQDAIREAPEGRDKNITIETVREDLDDTYVAEHLEAREGTYVVISVSDTGVGMDEKTRLHIFEPFFSTKETGKGTGLGLATVFGIVKQNGGFINVYSEPGKGTCFKIYWPTTEKVAALENDEMDILDESFSGGEAILLAEDVEELRVLMGEALRRLGYTVFEASNGLEALDIVRKERGIDLLITDIVMPGMNGAELAAEANRIIPSLKVIYTSGYTKNHIVHNGAIRNGVVFLQKPYTLAQLIAKIREVLK